MTIALRALLDYFEPTPPPDRGVGNYLIQQFIHRTKIEAAFTTGLTALACYCAATNELRFFFAKRAVIVLGVNLMARAVANGCRYAAIIEDKGLFFRTVSLGAEFVSPLCFAVGLTSCMIHPLIHEAGHVFTSLIVYRGNQIEVVAHSLLLWTTNASSTGYSSIGNFLGRHYSKMVFLGGGTLTTVIASQWAIALGLHFRSSVLSKYALLTALFALSQEFSYAKSALTESKIHDFTKLWKEGGLHPAAAMAAIVVMPLISTAGYLLSKR